MASRKGLSLLIVFSLLLMNFIVTPVSAEVVDVKAESYILVDADSGKVLLAKNEEKRLAPASMTKLMTLILAFEDLEEGKVGLKDKVIASENAWKMGGSQIYLEPGEELSYEDMLISIAVGSANDCCVAIAEHLEGTHKNFVNRMNHKAKMLGLKNTHFVNSHGLSDDNHYTTASDMAVMARHALNYPKLIEYSSIKEYNLRQGDFKLYNTNKLLWWYQGTDGFKTGFTNSAKHCLTSTVKRDGLRLIAVVMASPEQRGNFRDSMQILNYGFAKYSYKTFNVKGSVCGIVDIGKGVTDSVEVVALEDVGMISLKGEEKKITSEKKLLEYIDAPIKEGQKLGEVTLYQNGILSKKVDLVAKDDVPKAGLIKEILRMFAETYLL
ncbi:MAG TPA: D-alanyl-D-alanine carboxypeptidase family protein [Syntrophomonadaceae bacterium]|nr:D-alanyl-D-alanine carboxypeptidase family protein [Syntrophomonadaceae bacterium]